MYVITYLFQSKPILDHKHMHTIHAFTLHSAVLIEKLHTVFDI